MQRVGGALLVLLAAGWLASRIPAAPADPQPRETSWRRTCNGWERASWLHRPESRDRPALHPVVVGLAMVFFALAALIGLSPTAKSNPSRRVAPRRRE